ncbi:unnamed protein product, partial [Prorocentrum cordatum]
MRCGLFHPIDLALLKNGPMDIALLLLRVLIGLLFVIDLPSPKRGLLDLCNLLPMLLGVSDFEGPTYLQTLYGMEMHDDERAPDDEADVLLEEPADEPAVVPSGTDLADPLFLEMMPLLEAHPSNGSVETQTNMTYNGGNLSAVFPDYIPSENYDDGAVLGDHSLVDLDADAVPARGAVIDHHGANPPLSKYHREIAPVHHEEISEQKIEYAMRTLDIWCPVIPVDKKELLGDWPVSLELFAGEDAMLRDIEDEDDPALGSQALADAPLQSGVLPLPAEGLAGTSAAGEGAFPDHAPFDSVAQVAFGDGIMMNCDGVAISDLASVGDALPDLTPSYPEQLDNAADSFVGFFADASGSLDFYNASLRGSAQTMLGGGHVNKDMQQFMEWDGKVCRFYAVIDDLSTSTFERRPFVILYFLADDTFQIR